MRNNTNRLLAFCVGALLVSMSGARSQTSDPLLNQTIRACVSVQNSVESITSSITALGWKPVSNDALDETAITTLAASYLVAGVISSPPKPIWQSSWERKLKLAVGIRRVISVKDSRIQKTFFTRENSASLLSVAFSKGWKSRVITCDLTLVSSDVTQTLAGLSRSLGGDLSALPPIKRLPATRFDEADIKAFAYLTLLDAKEISDLIEARFDVSAIVNTYAEISLPEVSK